MVVLYLLVDYAPWLYIFLGIAAVALFMLWWINRKRVYLLSLGGVIALVLAVLLLTLFVTTPQQKIWMAIEEMADGFTSNNPAQTVRHLSRDFTHGDITRDNAQRKIEAVIAMYGLANVTPSNYGVEETDYSKGSIRVSFLIRVDTRKGEVMKMYRCEAEFVREDGEWRMKSFKRFPPFANADQEIPYPQP